VSRDGDPIVAPSGHMVGGPVMRALPTFPEQGTSHSIRRVDGCEHRVPRTGVRSTGRAGVLRAPEVLQRLPEMLLTLGSRDWTR